MNYVYDVLLNFEDEFYEFYDWNETDYFDHIRKIPIVKISSQALKEIQTNKVMLPMAFLKMIENKTEVFFRKKVKKIAYSCVLTDGLEAFAIFYKNNHLKWSSMILDEKEEVINLSERMEPIEIEYQITGACQRQEFKTRKQIMMMNYLEKEITILDQEKNTDKLQYIYYECFNEKETEEEMILYRLKNALRVNFDEISEKLYAFFKMTEKIN